MGAEKKSFDCQMKKAKYRVIRQFSYLSEETCEKKGVPLAVESCSTREFKGKTDVVDSRLDFQEPKNLSSEEDIVESRGFNKLQLLRNAMMMDGSGTTSSFKIKLIDDTAVISIPGHQNKGNVLPKTSYSREELVAMRFIGVVNQKRLWRDIYQGLGGCVAQEYATLVAINNPKPLPHGRGILGPIAGNGRPNIVVHPNIIRPFYAQNWPYLSQASCPASSTT